MTITLPALHQEFYDKFAEWQSTLDESVPRTGVYILKAGKPIPRFLATDDDGIMYIGKGVILSSSTRLGKFVNALNNTETSVHGGGDRFVRTKIQDAFPLENCKIEVTLSSVPENLEAQLLSEYEENFGEVPPLNRRSESVKYI
jgi:hypothetical protein